MEPVTEFFGLRTADDSNKISGLAFYFSIGEPAQLIIDDLIFGAGVSINPSSVPEPGNVLLVSAFIMSGGLLGMRRNR